MIDMLVATTLAVPSLFRCCPATSCEHTPHMKTPAAGEEQPAEWVHCFSFRGKGMSASLLVLPYLGIDFQPRS